MTKEELEKYTVDFMNNETSSNGSKLNSVLGKMLIKYAEIFQNCIADLEQENAGLRKVAEFQQSSNMSRHFENKKLKEGLAVGSILNKGLNSMNKTLEEERDKYRNMVFDKDEQLTKAKEIIKDLCGMVRELNKPNVQLTNIDYSLSEAKQFLKETE